MQGILQISGVIMVCKPIIMYMNISGSSSGSYIFVQKKAFSGINTHQHDFLCNIE